MGTKLASLSHYLLASTRVPVSVAKAARVNVPP